jgi:molybdopterin adenylyltransferase
VTHDRQVFPYRWEWVRSDGGCLLQTDIQTNPNSRIHTNQIAVGVITVSDRAFQGVYEDFGGPALREAATRYGWQILAGAIVPDDIDRIRKTIRSFSAQGCALILTTGGTGAALRDDTPEAIRSVMRVELPGFGEVMRAGSMKLTPNAILSRSLAAIVDRSLVIALPGKPQGAVDCLGFVAGAIPHSAAIAQEMPTAC